MSAAEEPVRFDPADFGSVPGARTLRRWIRTARRRRADKSFGQLFEDAYLIVFTVVMLGATGGSLLSELNEATAACQSYQCWELSDRLPLLLLPLLAGMTLRVLMSIGPVSASRAAGFWLLASPVDRTGLLRPSYRLVMLSVLGVGAVVSFAAWMVLGTYLLTAVMATGLTTALLLCMACIAVWAQQSRSRTKWVLRSADLLLAVAAMVALSMASLRAKEEAAVESGVAIGYSTPAYGWRADGRWVPYWLDLQLVATAGVGLLIAGLFVLVTAQTLDKLSRTSVVAGGELLTGLAGAAVALDVNLLADVVPARHWRLAAHRTSRRGRGFGLAAVVHRELLRVLRWPRRLVICFALLVVPYAVSGAGFELLVPVATAIAGFIAVRPLLDGMRSVLRSPGLLRAFGMTPGAVRRTFSVVPAVITVLWTTLAYPALGESATAFAVAAAILAGTIRQASAPPPSYGGPLLASPMGAIPPGLFSQPLRGPDLLLICLVPLLLGLSPVWVLAIPAGVLAVLFLIEPKRA